MAEGNTPKWQAQIEEILGREFPEEPTGPLKTGDLIALSEKIERPTGDLGKVIAIILKYTSERLQPLAAAVFGFQLGAAWERLNNKGDGKC